MPPMSTLKSRVLAATLVLGGALSVSPALAQTTGHPSTTGTPHSAPQVTIYGTSWCHFCHAAADYFRHQGIHYKWIDIEQDRAALRDLVRRARSQSVDASSVPIIDVNG